MLNWTLKFVASLMAWLVLFSLICLAGTYAQAQGGPSGSNYSLPASGLFFTTGGVSLAIAGPTQNATKLWGFVPLQTVTFTTIGYSIVTTADNTGNLYDIGILDASGNIVAHSGATAGTTFSSATGNGKNIVMLAPGTVYAGQKYYIAWTTNAAASPASLGGTSASSFLIGGAGATTSGGILAAGTPPADAYAGGNYPGITLHN